MHKRLFFLSLVAVIGVNIGLFWFLACPYRLLPSDDLTYFQGLNTPGPSSTATLSPNLSRFTNSLHSLTPNPGILATLAQKQNPVYWLFLWSCNQVWSLLNAQPKSGLIFPTLLANILTILAIIRINRQLTGSQGWAMLAGLLYMTSAWTNTYYYFFSYTSLPTALLITAFALALTSASQPQGSRKAWAWAALGGAVLGLAFWSAPSAIVLTAILIPLPALLHRPSAWRRGLMQLGWQLAGFAATFTPFVRISYQAFGNHIAGNIYTNHYDDALDKFGYIPQAPSFSFAKIMAEYSLLQTGLTVLLLLLLGVTLLLRTRQAHNDNGVSQIPIHLSRPLTHSLILLVILLIHATVIDLLPTTKLGRTHFHSLPFLFLFLTVTPYHLLPYLKSQKTQTILSRVYFALLISSMCLSIMKSLETRSIRFALPIFLANRTDLHKLYILKEDPHADYITQWLDDQRFISISTSAIQQVIETETASGMHGALLIGPNGTDSGNTILQHSTMPDFTLNLPPSLPGSLTTFPYSSAYPPFLFEEEICQSLYFSGQTPSPSSQAGSITVLSW